MAYPFRPQVLVGEFHGWKLFWLEVMGWGRMFCQHPPIEAYMGEPWAFDNAAFSAWQNGTEWDRDAYLRRLSKAMERQDRPMFGVLPDKPTKGEESLEFSCQWLDSGDLPDEWPWYLAVQDGMTFKMADPIIERIDGIFLGGSDDFKQTACDWSNYAHEFGKKFHYARCGTVEKLRLAFDSNADSLDSVGIIRNERRDNSFWRFAMEWKHPTSRFSWKDCKEMKHAG